MTTADRLIAALDKGEAIPGIVSRWLRTMSIKFDRDVDRADGTNWYYFEDGSKCAVNYKRHQWWTGEEVKL